MGRSDSIIQTVGTFYSIVQNDGICDTISHSKARFYGIKSSLSLTYSIHKE